MFAATLVVVCAFVIGYGVGVLRTRRLYGDGLTFLELHEIRCALWDWANEYKRANPTPGTKYFKRREANLFEACTKVGLIYLFPTVEWEQRLRPPSKDVCPVPSEGAAR